MLTPAQIARLQLLLPIRNAALAMYDTEHTEVLLHATLFSSTLGVLKSRSRK
jgi:hypothetical protein